MIEYGTLMDEIMKEIQGSKQGIEMHNGETIVNLLWMNDVALIQEITGSHERNKPCSTNKPHKVWSCKM